MASRWRPRRRQSPAEFTGAGRTRWRPQKGNHKEVDYLSTELVVGTLVAERGRDFNGESEIPRKWDDKEVEFRRRLREISDKLRIAWRANQVQECIVPAKGGDHPEMAKSHKLTENQVKSESVVFPKGGDVDTINSNNQDTLKTIIVE